MISIIVPSFNELDNLSELTHHLLSLTSSAQIIIVDASNQAASQRHVIRLRAEYQQHNQIDIVSAIQPGRAAQMNQGVVRARHDVLLFLHCDTRLPTDAFSQIEHCLNAGYLWGRFKIQLDGQRFVFRIIETMINLRSQLRRIATGDQAIFVSRDLFNEQGQFPLIPIMEDIALTGRLAKKNKPALINSVVTTSARRWQHYGVTKTILLMWKMRLLFWIGYSPIKLAKLYRNE